MVALGQPLITGLVQGLPAPVAGPSSEVQGESEVVEEGESKGPELSEKQKGKQKA
jgi:hypothetical protein